MSTEQSYQDLLKQDMGDVIDAIDLSDLQRRFLHSRWLDQVMWMDSSAKKARNRYYTLRMVTIIGGVIVPALVSLNLDSTAGEIVKWSTVGISLLVGISAAVEEFFHFGERWRHYRRTVESLKSAGWQFFQLSGAFNADTHANAYKMFASHVEDILQQDVELYITTVAREKEKTKEEQQESL